MLMLPSWCGFQVDFSRTVDVTGPELGDYQTGGIPRHCWNGRSRIWAESVAGIPDTVDGTGPELGSYQWARILRHCWVRRSRIWFTWHNVIKSWKLGHNSTYLSMNVVQS